MYSDKAFELPRDEEGLVKAPDTLPEVTDTRHLSEKLVSAGP